jgi:hypothetical protein
MCCYSVGSRISILMASETEQLAGGYWADVAELFIRGQLIKPFLGRPYLRLGQCFALWSSHFELGGMLAAKHCGKLDAFVRAFLGMMGETGAAERFFVEVANKIRDQHSLSSMNQWDFVAVHLGDRVIEYKRDNWTQLLMERGADKISHRAAAKNAWFYAQDGAALGAVAPDVVQGMFERTHVLVSQESWQRKYDSGLDIGPEPLAARSYQEEKEKENTIFMDWCREFYPDDYSALKE